MRWYLAIVIGLSIALPGFAKVLTPGEQYGGDFRFLEVNKDVHAFFYSTPAEYRIRVWQNFTTYDSDGTYSGWREPEVLMANTGFTKPVLYTMDYAFVTDGVQTKVYDVANYHRQMYVTTLDYVIDVALYMGDDDGMRFLLIDHSCVDDQAETCDEMTKLSTLTVTEEAPSWIPQATVTSQLTTEMQLGVDAHQAKARYYYDDSDTLVTLLDYSTDRLYLFTPTDGQLYTAHVSNGALDFEQLDSLQRILGHKKYTLIQDDTDWTGDSWYLLVRRGSKTHWVGMSFAKKPEHNQAFKKLLTMSQSNLQAQVDLYPDQLAYFYWPATVADQRAKLVMRTATVGKNASIDSTQTDLAGRFNTPVQFISPDGNYSDQPVILAFDAKDSQLVLYRLEDEIWQKVSTTSLSCPKSCEVRAVMLSQDTLVITWLSEGQRLMAKVWRDDTWEDEQALSPKGSVVAALPEFATVNGGDSLIVTWQDATDMVYSTMWQQGGTDWLRLRAQAAVTTAEDYTVLATTINQSKDTDPSNLNHYVVSQVDETLKIYVVTYKKKTLKEAYDGADHITSKKMTGAKRYLVAFRNAAGELQLEDIGGKSPDDF